MQHLGKRRAHGFGDVLRVAVQPAPDRLQRGGVGAAGLGLAQLVARGTAQGLRELRHYGVAVGNKRFKRVFVSRRGGAFLHHQQGRGFAHLGQAHGGEGANVNPAQVKLKGFD